MVGSGDLKCYMDAGVVNLREGRAGDEYLASDFGVTAGQESQVRYSWCYLLSGRLG